MLEAARLGTSLPGGGGVAEEDARELVPVIDMAAELE